MKTVRHWFLAIMLLLGGAVIMTGISGIVTIVASTHDLGTSLNGQTYKLALQRVSEADLHEIS